MEPDGSGEPSYCAWATHLATALVRFPGLCPGRLRFANLWRLFLVTRPVSKWAVLVLVVSTASRADAGMFTTFNGPGSTGTFAQGVSGNNVVGYYTDVAGHYHGFLA